MSKIVDESLAIIQENAIKLVEEEMKRKQANEDEDSEEEEEDDAIKNPEMKSFLKNIDLIEEQVKQEY